MGIDRVTWLRFGVSNDVGPLLSVLVDDACWTNPDQLARLESPSLFLALYCNGVPCPMPCFGSIVGWASIAFRGCVLASRTMLKLDFQFQSTMHVGRTLTSFKRRPCLLQCNAMLMLKLDFQFRSTIHVGRTLTSFIRLPCSTLVELQYHVVSSLLNQLQVP